MRMIDLGFHTAVTAGTAISTTGLGFLPGDTVKAEIFTPSGAFAGTSRIQTSVDGVTWTNAGPADYVAPGYNSYLIKLENFVRLNTTAFTSGGVKAVLFAEIG